jgi:hypothetical protein
VHTCAICSAAPGTSRATRRIAETSWVTVSWVATVILSRVVGHGCDLVFCVADGVADAAWEPAGAPVRRA